MMSGPTPHDRTGQRIGMLTAECALPPEPCGQTPWRWRCACGACYDSRPARLSARAAAGKPVACSACLAGRRRGPEPLDVRGERIGDLRAVKRVGVNAHCQSVWLWQCKCGGTRESIPSQLRAKARQGVRVCCAGCRAQKKRRPKKRKKARQGA